MVSPRRLLILAGCIAAAAACQKKISDRNLVLVNPDEGRRLATRTEGLLGIAPWKGAWVDPRSARDYQDGHIPGAISLPFQDVSEGYRSLEAYNVVIVYGNHFEDVRADAMSKRLMELGLKDVRTLRGGLQAWVAAGQPIVAGAGPGEPLKGP